MHNHLKISGVSFLVMALLATAPAFADRHEDESQRHGNPHRDMDRERDADRRDEHEREATRGYFNDHRRVVAREYYGEQFRHGHCPRGLAKKHDGCVAPGHAHPWAVGKPLPPNVVYYDLPPALVVQLGSPPPQHRYVRVASDILLIAVGTSVVVDAMQDLGIN